MPKPLLSIGIIFKNEIRCLERCLSSLQPLREAVPCELVMADTGADDGSREVAERYADKLIDFPWINDFAAARNAVMDQCSGKWYMTVDCDEWLDGDIARLVKFLTTEKMFDFASLIIRNYKSAALEKGGMYSDFAGCRIMRMSTGIRYEGAIHEHWRSRNGDMRIYLLENTILHHDGYVYTDPEVSRKKTERNMALLRVELKKDPDSLLLLMQCVESDANTSPEYVDYVRRGVEGVLAKRTGWKTFGPSLLRHAVVAASVKDLPEQEEWIALAEEWFPNSIFTRVDVAYMALGFYWNQENYAECIRRGEAYFRALGDFDTNNFNINDIVSSPVSMTSPYWRQNARHYLATSYIFEHQPEQCLKLVRQLDTSIMDRKQVANAARCFLHLQRRSGLDVSPELLAFWEQLNEPEPSAEQAEMRREEFLRISSGVFDPAYRAEEENEEEVFRHAYTVFLPLKGKCVLGDAAAILTTTDKDELEMLMEGTDDLSQLPVPALAHALAQGVTFPQPDKPVKMEELDLLAGRLAQHQAYLRPLINRLQDTILDSSTQSLDWARSLTFAAIRSITDWKQDPEWNMSAVQAFVQVERVFLPQCYATGIFNEADIGVLPPMHRFGWYCVRAFSALDGGDAVNYVHLLRTGLETYQDMKPLVQFLIDNTPEIQTPPPSAELQMLAEQIRAVLANFALDDPAVIALKKSEAYQKVAYLIEGAHVPVAGGLLQ